MTTSRNRFSEANSLTYFDPKKQTILQVDASQEALGAALVQDERIVAYASKSLTDTEKRYANIERELLACVFATEHFHNYIYGKPVIIESDHNLGDDRQEAPLSSSSKTPKNVASIATLRLSHTIPSRT